jgi:hypothetical protein
MPYIHWELREKLDDMERVIHDLKKNVPDVKENAPTDLAILTMPAEEQLIQAYLNHDHSLHIRQTLDESYYIRDDALRAFGTMPAEEKLIRAYLNLDHPLHIRRTLDQYYYYAQNDTTTRDEDQVVFRYFETENMNGKEKRVAMMVDQLWVWVLGGKDI